MNQSFRALSIAEEETVSGGKEEMGGCGGLMEQMSGQKALFAQRS